jgi:hypothetical protein
VVPDVATALTLAGQFGPMGLMVGYLVWREPGDRKDRREHAERERDLARERINADLELARAMTLLTVTIQGRS